MAERLADKFREIINEQDFCFTPREMKIVEISLAHFNAYENLGTVETLQKLKDAADSIVWAWDNCYIEAYHADVKDYIEQMRLALKEDTANDK